MIVNRPITFPPCWACPGPERPWLTAYYHSELEMRIAPRPKGRDRDLPGRRRRSGLLSGNPIPLAAAGPFEGAWPDTAIPSIRGPNRAGGGHVVLADPRHCPTGDAQAPGSQREWAFISRNLMVCGPAIAADARERLLVAAHSVPQSSVLAPGKRLHSQYVQIPHDF